MIILSDREFKDGCRRLIFKDKPANFYKFIEGDFNCNGFGSVFLGPENNYGMSLIFSPGLYNLKIRKNQDGILEYKRFRIQVESVLHEPSDPKFLLCMEGTCLVTVLSKFNNVEIESDPEPIYMDSFFSKGIWYYYVILRKGSTYEIKLKDQLVARYIAIKKDYSPKNSIIYQIFPDRFNISNPNKIFDFSNWNDPPTYFNFYGGNLKGIAERIDYLKELGVDAVYLNPIFKSEDNHRYTVDDYFTIDERLGDQNDLVFLVSELRKNGIGIIFDMVFNHVSTNNEIFKGDSQEDPTFKGWIMRPIGREDAGNDYFKFKNFSKMPKLNTSKREVRRFLKDVESFWIERFKPAGIRYDVADSIYLNASRGLTKYFKNTMHIGELWCEPSFFLINGSYNSYTNYYLRDAIIALVTNKITIRHFLRIYYYEFSKQGRKRLNAVNLLSSHDVPRIITLLGSKDKAIIAYSILLASLGNPLIYYGDEVGLEGGPDPDCRRTFPWGKEDKEMLSLMKNLIRLWKENQLFRNGFIKGSAIDGIKILDKISAKNEIIHIMFNTRSSDLGLKRYDYFKDSKVLLKNRIAVKREEIIFKKDSLLISLRHTKNNFP